MKSSLLTGFLVCLLCLLLLFLSCGRLGEDSQSGNCKLSVFFSEGSELLTRSYMNIPDTNDFYLKVLTSSGESIYDGPYGGCPEVLDVSPGSYTVSVRSAEFSKPAFDFPVFGDDQCVVVQSGGHVYVNLVCSQVNSGVRLDISQDFKSSYSDAVLLLKSANGSLMYSFAEKRTAYFMPGTVSLVMSRGPVDDILAVKDLNACEMLLLKVLAPAATSEAECGMTVSIDTTRVWLVGDCMVGSSSSSGAEDEDAMTISDARKAVGQENVWVSGYIVGGDLTSASASFIAPFKSASNILIGPRSSVSDKASCMSVQLPDNEVREALNLVSHPELLGRRVCLKGDVVASYFGICGLKNTSEYMLY